MTFSLAQLTRRTRNVRRRAITIRDIAPPATLASSLSAIYRRVVDTWARGADRIMAAYERSLAEIATDAPADVQREIDSIGAELQRLFLILTPKVRDWAIGVERWHRGRWRGAVLAATGVDLQTLIGAEAVRAPIETHIEWNTSLIRDVSAQTQQRIGNAVFDGLRNRTPAREVGKQIRESVGMARDRSNRIAADQLNKLTSSLADERRREAGITAWEWKWSRKKHGREEHIARDGKYYTDAHADVGKEVDGKKLNEAPKDRVGQLPWCGCRALSVISFD